MTSMRFVPESELRNHLRAYLREVRDAGEICITRFGKPVAYLVGIPPTTGGPRDERRERLIRNGLIRPGNGNTALVLDTLPLKLPRGLRLRER